jgi:hypothetical protein
VWRIYSWRGGIRPRDPDLIIDAPNIDPAL